MSAESLLAEGEGEGTSGGATGEFLQRVLRLPEGDKVLSCIQCGMCSG